MVTRDVNDQVKVQETIVTGKDGHALFQVTDGSTFEVFPNAKVIFRKLEVPAATLEFKAIDNDEVANREMAQHQAPLGRSLQCSRWRSIAK